MELIWSVLFIIGCCVAAHRHATDVSTLLLNKEKLKLEIALINCAVEGSKAQELLNLGLGLVLHHSSH